MPRVRSPTESRSGPQARQTGEAGGESRGRRARPGCVASSMVAGRPARLFAALPPCFFTCSPTIASTTPRWSASRCAAVDEVIGQRPVFLERPGLEGGDELDLVDQPVLQRQQAEEQVAVRGRVVHASSLRESRAVARLVVPASGCPRRPRPHDDPARLSHPEVGCRNSPCRARNRNGRRMTQFRIRESVAEDSSDSWFFPGMGAVRSVRGMETQTADRRLDLRLHLVVRRTESLVQFTGG